MIETFIIALFTLLIALYVQARRAAREIRENRGDRNVELVHVMRPTSRPAPRRSRW